ncbi:MAG: WD40 repeat domain-containing protein [Pirellulales bacterium]|nr:WD40 repeat domain-containing protein [Pirellulales bacterium]
MLDVKQTHAVTEFAHDRPLISCRFDPQGRYVFAGSEDRTVLRWSLADGAKASLAAHESWVKAIAFSKDGAQTITGGYDGKIAWWTTDAAQPAPLRTIDAHQGWIRSMSVSPDGGLLATAGNDLAVRLWNLGDGSLVRELVGHERHVYSVQFHPSGEFLLSGDLVGVVKQWNVASGEVVRSFDAKPLHTYEGGQQVDFGGVRSLAVSADGRRLAAGGLHKATNPLGAVHEPLALLWEWESQKLVQSHITEGIAGGGLWRVTFLADQTLAGASGGSSGGFLLFWKADQDKDFHRFGLPALARDMDLHPDGIRAATAHYDQKVRISALSAAA